MGPIKVIEVHKLMPLGGLAKFLAKLSGVKDIIYAYRHIGGNFVSEHGDRATTC